MSPTLLLVLVLCALAALALVALVVVRRRRRARRPAPALPRWPVVLVHGWMGFDELGIPGVRPHYFRGIARHLEARGVVVHRPRLPATGSVPERAEKLAAYLRALPAKKVNVIAHSMGGLDARWAISRLGLGDRVASLITIGTPHRGTPLADLANVRGARAVRRAVQRGRASDAIDWLTTTHAARFNEDCADDPRVCYACVIARTSFVQQSTNPMLLATHAYMRVRAGSNDGIVPTSSQAWGEILREIELDHWAQVGWSLRHDATELYDGLLAALAGKGL